MKQKNKKTKNIKVWIITIIGLIIIVPIITLIFIAYEGEEPTIDIEIPPKFIGKQQNLSLTFSDLKSGIQKIWVAITQNGKDIVLCDKEYTSSLFFPKKRTNFKNINLEIKPKKMGIKNGSAILRIVVTDYSWSNWFKGNRTYIEQNVIIDTISPEITVLSKTHNLIQGGSGVVIYSVSEICENNGIVVGNNFYPGHSGFFKDKNIYIAFFALAYDLGRGTNIFIQAKDYAQNISKAGFPYYIKKKKFKKDYINISNKFLSWKMPEFDVEVTETSDNPLLNKFISVNNKIRKNSIEKISKILSNSDNIMYWKGRFLRLPNAARRANFGDKRYYKYNGKVIDEQIHMGMDLASLKHSPVPASNNGKIVFVGPIGIYGKTVVIDHGFGLFSSYSHLSKYNTKENTIVKKGETIGYTGNTGLAGGDHLHFAISIYSTFVNPVEWWDARWIKHNITNKIKDVENLYSPKASQIK